MKSVFQKISYQIRPFPRMQKKTRKNAFGLQIVINGDPRMIPIEVLWFAEQFDANSETFRHSQEHQEVIRDLNLVIAKEKSRANDIITRYRLNDRTITHKQFRWEFSNYVSRQDVHEWLKSRAKKALDDGEILNSTHKGYSPKFARLKEFYPAALPFSEINTGFIVKFDNHIRKTFAYNTVIGTHKTLRKFFSLAVKEGLINETPYNDKIKNRYNPGDREALEPKELEQLISLFIQKHLFSTMHLNVLEMFVFAATSGGYRFSELQLLTSNNIKHGVLKMDTVKGQKTGVHLNIELPNIGQKIIAGRKGKIFEKVAEPTANKCLKDLIGLTEIKKHITFHSARDTFGTLYVYYGGDITVLSKEIFKHSKLETTMIYQKKSTNMKRKDMENFNVFSLPDLDPAQPKT